MPQPVTATTICGGRRRRSAFLSGFHLSKLEQNKRKDGWARVMLGTLSSSMENMGRLTQTIMSVIVMLDINPEIDLIVTGVPSFLRDPCAIEGELLCAFPYMNCTSSINLSPNLLR